MNAETILEALVQKKYELILCDAITNRIARVKSLNTLLITSGFESVKTAYQEAINIVSQIQHVKVQQEILEQGILSQEQGFLIFDSHYEIHFTNLDTKLAKNIIETLQGKPEKAVQQYYSQTLQAFLTLLIKPYTVEQKKYYSCIVDKQHAPVSTKQPGISYQKKKQVAENFSSRLLFSQFIPESVKEEIREELPYYQTYFIFGETGTAKKNIAYQIFLEQTMNQNYLITINCKLINEKFWKFIVNATNGPFVDTHNTIFFDHIEQLALSDVERLISMVQTTNVYNQNTLIFTYDGNQATDNTTFSRLINQLNGVNLYAPSIRERKNELSIITTLLVNKMNIECNKDIIGFEPKALEAFLDYDWPGNFNQLQDCIKELVINASTHYISEHQITELLNKERLIQNFADLAQVTISPKNTLHQPTLFDYTKEIIRTTLWRYLKEDQKNNA